MYRGSNGNVEICVSSSHRSLRTKKRCAKSMVANVRFLCAGSKCAYGPCDVVCCNSGEVVFTLLLPAVAANACDEGCSFCVFTFSFVLSLLLLFILILKLLLFVMLSMLLLS